MPAKKHKKTNVVVNQQFLLDLANDIYDPKSRKFLRLCDGKLTNGPDPTDSTRPMHCGLGELYYAMTGRHTTEDHVSEDDVVETAIRLSTLPNLEEIRDEKQLEVAAAADRAVAVIKALKLPKQLEDELVDQAESFELDIGDEDVNEKHRAFHDALGDIPGSNDDGDGDACGIDAKSNAVYRERSRRVASQLRKAAKLLPS